MIKSHTEPKMPLTPSHACDQLPVKIPMNTSKIPVITPRTVSRIFAICVNTPSKIGARKLQRPFQRADTTSLKFWKSNPNAFSLSVMPCAKPLNTDLILSQMAIMLFLKSSLVLHKCTKAAANTAITATTATTGAEMPPMAAPTFPMMPDTPPALLIRLVSFSPSLLNACMATPTLDITVPSITRNGPKAATKSPILTMTCLVPSSRLFSQSTKD